MACRLGATRSIACIVRKVWPFAASARIVARWWCIGKRDAVRHAPTRPGLDFVHDQFSNGQKLRTLTVVDIFSRESLAIEVGQRLRVEHVVEVFKRLLRQRGAPRYLFADNGAEFTGHLVDLWAYHHGTRIDSPRPGKPTDNAFIETFNGSLRDECPNVYWFATIAEAKALIEAWRRHYNESRPHMALKNETPQEYLLRTSSSGALAGSKAGGN
jgi:putative transposase